MRALIQQHPVAFVLSAVAVLLAVVIGLEAGVGGVRIWPQTPQSAARPAASAEAKLVPPLASVNPEEAYPESAARPPFTPTRRPAPVAAAVASTMVRGQFTLQGVIAVGNHKIALLREKSSGRVHRVEVGREVNGLTLASIESDKVTLSQGAEQEPIFLQVQKGPAVAAAPPAAAAGPFAAPPPPVAAAPAGQPPPGVPPVTPVPGTVAGAPGVPTPNPAARSGFGPHPQQATPAEPAAALTPEELLARRRARRQQQESNTRGTTR